MDGDSKTKGIVQAPAIKSNARKKNIPPKTVRVLKEKTAEEFTLFGFIFNLYWTSPQSRRGGTI